MIILTFVYMYKYIKKNNFDTIFNAPNKRLGIQPRYM